MSTAETKTAACHADASSETASRGVVLVVDDDEPLARSLKKRLERDGFEVFMETDPVRAELRLGNPSLEVVLTDVKMPKKDGVTLCREIHSKRPDVEVVVMTALGSVETAVAAMKAGAYDFLTKPFESQDVVTLTIEKALERRRLIQKSKDLEQKLSAENRFENIVGSSARMKSVFQLIESVAPTDTTVLITGESGTGKELVAKAIHERSKRAQMAYRAVNCTALVDTLLESELFGHVKGAFTGAISTRRGLFEEANGGTLFLDEVGEMNSTMQAKLLRVLQEGEIKPVGSDQPRRVDVRVLAATNMNLQEAIAAKLFREDLYYRLKVLNITIPPLRERPEDVPLLISFFLRKFTKKIGKSIKHISPDAMGLLKAHRWPGNVRELEHVIERAIVICTQETLDVSCLPEELMEPKSPGTVASAAFDQPFREAKEQAVGAFEKAYVIDLLSRTGGVLAEAARHAGMDRSNFRRLVQKYDIEIEKFRHGT